MIFADMNPSAPIEQQPGHFGRLQGRGDVECGQAPFILLLKTLTLFQKRTHFFQVFSLYGTV